MKKFFTKTKQFAVSNKLVAGAAMVLIVAGGYTAYKNSGATVTVTKYVVEDATTGSVVSTVSGSGQVQNGETIQVSPKVSETVTSIPVKVGTHVAVGQLLLQLDATNEQRSLRQAQLSLQQAQLSLQELQQVATTSLLQQQTSVTNAQQSLMNASTSLSLAYQNGFDTISTTFIDLQTVMDGLKNFALGYDLNKNQNDPDAYVSILPNYLQASGQPYKNNFQSQYIAAIAMYQKNLSDYSASYRSESTSSLSNLFNETYATTQLISNTVKSAKDFLTYIQNTIPQSSSTAALPAITTTFQNNFTSYTNTVNNDISSVGNISTGIQNDMNTIISSEASLRTASETLSELVAGPTQTQLLSQQISIENAQNSLQTAQENLAYTSVRSPIAGVVSAIGATIGQTPGSSAITIVGEGELAQITLNEVDASKIAVGDKATLQFDAIDGLSLAGSVAEVDPVGTVTQGVVSYNVQIDFTQASNTTSTQLVKPGMSVDAEIITAIHQNVITVPNAALTTLGSSTYILEPATALSTTDLTASANGGTVLAETPQRVAVTVGLANDTESEITSGITVGDQIVVQTIKSSTAKKTATATTSGSALQLLGGAGAARTGAAGATGGFTRGQ